MKSSLLFACTCFSLVSLGAQTPSAPSPTSGKPLTVEQGDEIIRELRTIRNLLETVRSRELAGTADNPAPAPRPAAPVPSPDGKPALAKITIDPARTIGSDKAPITLVEFTDFQCGFCSMFHRQTFASIRRDFIDTGLVRFASMDLPLDFHSEAFLAAKASRCASDQSKYWEYRDLLSQRPQPFSVDTLLKMGDQVGLNQSKLRECVDSKKFDASIKTDMLQAEQANLSATPSFILGKSTASGVEGEAIVGAYPFEYFKEALTRVKAMISPDAAK